MTVFNIASNLPTYWHAGTKPADEQEKFIERVRVKMIEHIPGYAAALHEEIEAQLHYNQHKHEKKSNPSVFYTAKERLFTARWAVKAFHDDGLTFGQLTRMVNEELKQEALSKFAPPAEAFKDWLIAEVQLYYTALKHPSRVFCLCSPNAEVYRKRYALLAQALRVCLTEGADAAYTLWKVELGDHFDEIYGQDTGTFQEIEGRRGEKSGYWIPGESAMRPILVNDPATIKQNEEAIDRESVREARANRFDYEVETPVVEAPKKLRGRPKGVKNKPKRPTRPVSPDVAAWQAEADRKLGYRAFPGEGGSQ